MPKRSLELDLEKVNENIENYSFEILAFTGSMLSLRKESKIKPITAKPAIIIIA